MDLAGGTKFRREFTPHVQELFNEGGSKLGGLSYRILSPDQTRLQPKHTPPIPDGVGFMGTYLAQGDFREWPDQISVHCPTHEHMLQIGQRIHTLHIREEEASITDLAEPFIVPVIKGSLIPFN